MPSGHPGQRGEPDDAAGRAVSDLTDVPGVPHAPEAAGREPTAGFAALAVGLVRLRNRGRVLVRAF